MRLDDANVCEGPALQGYLLAQGRNGHAGLHGNPAAGPVDAEHAKGALRRIALRITSPMVTFGNTEYTRKKI